MPGAVSTKNIKDGGGNTVSMRVWDESGAGTGPFSFFPATVAHDAADDGHPIKAGTKAAATLSTATLVAAADRANAVGDLDGALVVRADATLGDVASGAIDNTDGASTQVIAAAGSGIRTYLTDFTLSNSAAGATIVDIKDGTTVKWTVNLPGGATVTHSFRTPLAGTANTAWNVDARTAVTTLHASFAGFKSKV